MFSILVDGAARSGRRTPEPHVWPAAPLSMRGDCWRGAAMSERYNAAQAFARGEWVSLPEVLHELMPEGEWLRLTAALECAVSIGNLRTLLARMTASKVPGSRSQPLTHYEHGACHQYRGAIADLSAYVTGELSGSRFLTRVAPSDGIGPWQEIDASSWRLFRVTNSGFEFDTPARTLGSLAVQVSSRSSRRARIPLGHFEIKHLIGEGSVPSKEQSISTPDAELSATVMGSEIEVRPASMPTLRSSQDEVIEALLAMADIGEMTQDGMFAHAQRMRTGLTKNYFKYTLMPQIREAASLSGISLRGRGRPSNKKGGNK